MKDYPYVPGWRLNKNSNKPRVKTSVLMFTRHGVAEGEYDGGEWVQYRWSCKVKDCDVLYWIHLEDLTQLEKEGENIQQEQPETPSGEEVMTMCNQILIDWVKEGKTPEEREQREQAHIRFFELYDEYMQEQPEVDLEKEIDEYFALWRQGASDEGCVNANSQFVSLYDCTQIARYFYELGLNARKEEAK